MTHGRIPSITRFVWIKWCCFWYRQQQHSRRKELEASRARWAAAPAHWDDLQLEIDQLECLITDMEQELV